MRTERRPPHLRPKTPQGPRGHFRYQLHGYAMVTIYTHPIAMGGLGIRRVSSLALPTFLTSAVGTLALQSDILKQLEGNQDPLVEDLEARWRIESGITIPNSFSTHIPSKWDQPLFYRT